MDTSGLLLLWQEDDMELIMDNENTLTPSEAIYAFCAWLTTRKETIQMGSFSDCAPVANVINEFMKANNLDNPRGNYTDYFRMPTGN